MIFILYYQAISEGTSALEDLRIKIRQEKENAIALSKSKRSKEKAKVIANLVISTTYLETQVGKLIQDGINSTLDFFWKSHFRYYWEEDNLMVRIVLAEFMYGY